MNIKKKIILHRKPIASINKYNFNVSKNKNYFLSLIDYEISITPLFKRKIGYCF